jgi:DMSO/TMAO reductase YedYZ heme-binding membrane subunit
MARRSAIAATAARRPDATAARGDLAIIAGGTTLSLTWAAILLWGAGTDSDGTELALRMTARASFVWFMLAFIAAPLHQLRPSRLTAWLLRHRRALGVTFGLSMAIHVGFILRLFVLHAPDRPPMVTDADFFIGIPGLLLVAALTVTSLDALKERLGPVAWRRLHTTGIWVVWAIFFLCLVDSVGRKTTNHPFLAYYAFIAVLLGGVALRIIAYRRRSSRPINRGLRG